MGPSPVVFIVVALSTINYATLQTVPTTSVSTSKRIVTSASRVSTSTDNITTITTQLFTATTRQMESMTVSVDDGERLLRSLGSDATITCSVSGSGAINVFWIGPKGNTLKNNTKYTVTPYNINTGKSTLTIFALSTTDNGMYICRVTDGSGSTAEDSITLTVHGTTGSGVTTSQQNIEKTTPGTKPNNATTQNNQTVSQRLVSTAGTTGLGVTTSQQNIERTTHGTTHNNATTHETVHNNATTPNNQTLSQKLVSTAVPLTVSVDNGETLLGQVGSDAIITCSVSGSGAIKVVWIGPLGNTLTNNTKYSVTSYNINIGKSTLAIFALSMTDIGLYTCRAMDGFGSTAEDSITITVHGTTGLGVTTSQQNIERTTHGTTHNNATTPNNQTVSQRLVSTAVPLTVSVDNGETLLGQVGSDAIITCSVSGSGAIKVVWIGPLGNTLTNNTKYSVTSYNINIGKSTLAIFALSMTDIGLYTCRAMDGFGSTAEDSITLTVYGTTGLGVTTSQQNIERTTHGTTHNNATTPNNQTVSQRLVSTAVPLTVSVDNGETLLGQVGSDAIITCSVSGSGAIKVVWIGPLGNTLTNNTKYSVTSYNINIGKSTLAIFALSMTDIGLYTCRAMDGFGSTAEDSITLTVYGTTGLGVTTLQQNIERTTHGTTHNNATTPNNQTVSQRLVSTAVPLTVSVDNGETLLGQVGSDAIITCSVSGSGAIKVVWIGPLGNTLTNNTKYSVTSYNINIGKSTLAIFALSMTDIGLYTCRAMDGFGSTAEDSITLTVYGTTGLGVTTSQQNIERTTHGTTHNNATTPNNQTVSQRLVSTAVPLTVSVDNGETLLGQVGSDAIITCSVSGSGAIKVVWIGPLGNTLTNNTKYSVTSYNINIGKSTLAIFALSMTDIGLYTCRAMDGFGSTAEDSITLTVHESTGSGMSPEMTTSKQNMITITTATATSTLNIAPTTPNNQTVIQRLESTTVPLTVSIDDGETMFRQIGSDATITCSASGVGNINVVWIGPAWNTLTNNAKYNVTSYNINTGKSTLTIFALSTTDSGSYICLATDGFRSTAYDSITLTVHAGITGTGMTPGMRTSKQTITTTTPEASTATHNMISTMPSNQTVIQRLVSTTTTETSAATHSMVPTMPSNQTVIPRQLSTTTPEASKATHNMIPTMPSHQTAVQRLVSTTVPLTVSVDNGETMLRQVGSHATITCSVSGSGTINVIWIGPALKTLANNTKYTVTPCNINTGKSTLTIFALCTTDNGLYMCRATDGSGSLAEDSITLTVHRQSPPEVASVPHSVTMPSPLMLNSSQDMPSSTLTITPTSIKGLDVTTGMTSPAMATTPQNIAAAEQISTTSMNSTTPLPIGITKRETRSTTGIPEQSNNCCFNENMVIMLRDNVPLVNGFIPFVSILEQTNGTDISVCDAKVLLKATFRRSNQTAPCQGCTSVPQCGNQMLKIDLWMSPNKNRFSFHAGDSITNNGYGGDNNTQENDAEFHIYNYEQRLYGSDKCLNMSQLIFSLPNNSAHWVTIYIGNEFIRVSTPLGDAYELCSDCLFALNGQSDLHGTVNEDIYVGLNRIIRSSYSGDGSGVCGAVISWACPWKT